MVVGSGPNGLAAAVLMARAGLAVELREAAPEVGGGLRSARLFDPDVMHDSCSAVHPLAAASRFFREFDLGARGVELLQPEAAYAHPLDGGRAGLAYRSLDHTCQRLGADGVRWRRLMEPLVRRSRRVLDLLQSDLRHPPLDPRSAFLVATRALATGTALSRHLFSGERAPAMLAGVAAHPIVSQPSLPAGGIVGLLAPLAHSTGWALPRGGSQRIAAAMVEDLLAHGGKVRTGSRVLPGLGVGRRHP